MTAPDGKDSLHPYHVWEQGYQAAVKDGRTNLHRFSDARVRTSNPHPKETPATINSEDGGKPMNQGPREKITAPDSDQFATQSPYDSQEITAGDLTARHLHRRIRFGWIQDDAEIVDQLQAFSVRPSPDGEDHVVSVELRKVSPKFSEFERTRYDGLFHLAAGHQLTVIGEDVPF